MTGVRGPCLGGNGVRIGPSCHLRRGIATRAQGAAASPVRLRVERQPFLPADRADAWAALRSIVPPEAWEEQAPVLAALESVYRAEYQQQAVALQRAYKATKRQTAKHDGNRWDGRTAADSSGEESQSSQAQPAPHSATGGGGAKSDAVDRNGAEASVSHNSTTGDEHGAEFQEDARKQEAEEVDQEFLRQFVRLLRKANYMPLSLRDEAMSQSLNADYVDQLFISPDLERLDEKLVGPIVADWEVPSYARYMLVFKRGYGQTRRRGLMLVAKLDYLQYVVVQAIIRNSSATARRLWRRARERWAAWQESAGDRPGEGKAQALDSTAEADLSLWDSIQQAVKKWAAQTSDSGTVPPRFLLAGGGLLMTLSNWGLLPQIGVEPIDNFKEMRKLEEPKRLSPVFVERVSLRNAISNGQGLTLQGMLDKIELAEPTFQELVVLYRRVSPPGWLEKLGNRLRAPQQREPQQPAERQQISMRIYRDIPVPTWKLVFPEKLLQFRPLEGLRADLLTVAGLVAFIAQAKYDSTILELITLSSAIVYASRVFLGYKRMNDRFDQMAKDMLAETMMAGQEPVIDCVAGAAALQQFLEAALAYCMLQQGQAPMDAEHLCVAVEELLEERFQVKVRFDAAGTMSELERLGLMSSKEGRQLLCSPARAVEKLRARWDLLLQPEPHEDPALALRS